MDSKNVDVFQELTLMQSRINSLFKDIVTENEQFKSDSKEHKTKLDRMYKEMEELKKQNEIIKGSNEQLKDLFLKCFNIFKLKLSSLNLLQTHQPVLEALQNNFVNIINNSNDSEDCKLKHIVPNKEENSVLTRLEFDETTIKKEIEAISILDLSTQCFVDTEVNKSTSNQWVLNKAKSELILEKFFERNRNKNELENIRKMEEPLVRETEVLDLSNANHSISINTNEPGVLLVQNNAMKTPEKKLGDRSPVFKDLGNRKQENLEDNDSSKPTSLRLVNEKFLLKSSDMIVSPVKRTTSHDSSPSPKRGSTTPKRIKLNTPNSKRSPAAQLKKSNSREAEISVSGIKKLTQTILNIDCFKRKSPEKGRQGSSKENKEDAKKTKEGVDVDEDDVIMDSPKRSEQTKNELAVPKVNIVTPPPTSGVDLDVTYVSSSVIKNLKSERENHLEIDDQTPLKRPSRELSPESESVPFVYKREPIRKKMERMKLPGHACIECDKYYKAALGSDVKTQDLKEVLNKCSRHRDKNPPSLDETPAGYWKPYLTANTAISPGKDGTILR